MLEVHIEKTGQEMVRFDVLRGDRPQAALALVIGLLLLCFAASRKGLSLLPGKRSGQIHILETRPLGGKKMLCLVQVRGQELLLGVSGERIDCLTRLPARDSQFQTTLEQLEPKESATDLETGA